MSVSLHMFMNSLYFLQLVSVVAAGLLFGGGVLVGHYAVPNSKWIDIVSCRVCQQ